MIYFIQHGEDGYIKIGYTSRLETRLRELRKQYGVVTLLGICDGDKTTERELHSRFSTLNRFGEWYRPTDELREFIAHHTHAAVIRPYRRDRKTVPTGKLRILQLQMSKAAQDRIQEVAARRGFKSRAAYVRSLIAQDAPELKNEFESVEWGGDRRGDKSE